MEMTIEFRCTECQHLLRTSDDKAGLSAACPSCGVQLTVPQPTASDIGDLFEKPKGTSKPRASQRKRPSSGQNSGTKDCPMCGAKVSEYDSNCPDCGESLSPPIRQKSRRLQNQKPHRGGLILGLGIGGWLCCPFICIAAVVMGHQDLAQIKSGVMDQEGKGLTLAGVIIGWVSIIGNLMVILVWLLIVIASEM